MEEQSPTASIIAHFSSIPDPRIERGKKHKLIDIVFMTLCAVISGADGWVAVAEYSKAKAEWLTKLLNLETCAEFVEVTVFLHMTPLVTCFQ